LIKMSTLASRRVEY